MGIYKNHYSKALPVLMASLMLFAFVAERSASQTAEGEITQERVALSSPRETVRSFYEAMGGVVAGNDERLPDAIACLYLGDDLTQNERLNQGRQIAEQLYAILERLQFRIDDIAQEVDGDSYVAELGTGEDKASLRLHRYEDSQWRFNSETLSEGYLEEMAAVTAEKNKEEEEAEAEAGVQFHERMRSPRTAMMTFLRGMNEADGFTREDALATLDLTHINASVRREVGLELAHQLKAVIDRYKYVEISELPPESQRAAYIFLSEPEGRIVLDVVTDDEREVKAWKFTQASLNSVEDLYLKYRDKPVAAGIRNDSSDLPFSIRMRDWINDTIPFAMNRAFYLQNWQWLGLFVVILLGKGASRLITTILLKIIQRRFRQQHFHLDKKLGEDFVRPIHIALMAWFWLLGLTLLGVPPEARFYLRITAQVVTAFGAVWAIYRLIDVVGNYMQERAAQTENTFDDLLVPIVTRSLKVFVIVIAIVILANQFGQNPMQVVAGLGLGGLAFALAAKDVVANIFGSFTILLDRPFKIGDWITVGDIDGSVESVGIRSTRIRTFYDSLITVPNSELINTSVDNWGEREYRRIMTYISIGYDTPAETIDAFCEGIRQLIRSHPYTRKDFFLVHLNQFKAASLDILLYCFVKTPDWGTEMRERHRLFLDIIRLARKLEVEFAFPTQTVYMRQDQAPEYPDRDNPHEAMRLGRREAEAIVRAFTGPAGTIPPPVRFGPAETEGEAPGDNSTA